MHAVSFTAGEIADTFLLVTALEVETRDICTTVDFTIANLHDFDTSGNFFVNRSIWVESVTTLVDVTQRNGVTDSDCARIGAFLTGNHSEQSCLACAVGADDPDDSCWRQIKREIFNQQSIAVSLREIFDFNHDITQTWPRWNRNF